MAMKIRPIGQITMFLNCTACGKIGGAYLNAADKVKCTYCKEETEYNE